jgi:hypothetical protein
VPSPGAPPGTAAAAPAALNTAGGVNTVAGPMRLAKLTPASSGCGAAQEQSARAVGPLQRATTASPPAGAAAAAAASHNSQAWATTNLIPAGP